MHHNYNNRHVAEYPETLHLQLSKQTVYSQSASSQHCVTQLAQRKARAARLHAILHFLISRAHLRILVRAAFEGSPPALYNADASCMRSEIFRLCVLCCSHGTGFSPSTVYRFFLIMQFEKRSRGAISKRPPLTRLGLYWLLRGISYW